MYRNGYEYICFRKYTNFYKMKEYSMKDISYWKDIDYLSIGTEIQKQVFELLTEMRIFIDLKEYDPILVGTVPIKINVDGSDLDIICEVLDFEKFEENVRSHYEKMTNFSCIRSVVNETLRIVANFTYNDWEIEIFGQPLKTTEQNGFKHMIVEARILEMTDEKFRKKIISIKSNGIKTEPAFAQVIGLSGDPYIEMLKLYELNENELMDLLIARSIDVF